MSKGCQVEFGSGDLAPDFEHIPESNIIEEQERVLLERNCFEILQEGVFKDDVLGAINEKEVTIA